MDGAVAAGTTETALEGTRGGKAIKSMCRRRPAKSCNTRRARRGSVRTVGKIGNDELDPAFRSRLLDGFKDFR